VKRFQSVSLLLSAITAILVVILVSIFAISAMNALDRQREAVHILSVVKISRDIVTVRETLRVELGVSDTTIAEPGAASEATRLRLVALHSKSAVALNLLVGELEAGASRKITPAVAKIKKKESFMTGCFPRPSWQCGYPGSSVLPV
jgi:hypothetical protein